MNYFFKLPLKRRLVVVLSFLVASVVVGIVGKPSRVLLLIAALLLLSGGWRISKPRSFVFVLILMPALVGLVLTHFDWHHPFLSRYAAGLFSVIAVLLLMDGIRIEEWIELLHAKGDGTPVSRLAPLLVGTAVGTISMSSNIQEQRACRKLANVHAWRAKSKTSIFLDSVALPFYNAVESHDLIDDALHRWGAHDAGSTLHTASESSIPADLTFGNSNFTARLSDLNDFPGFRNVSIAAMSKIPIAEAWSGMISQLSKPARVLDIGDPTKRFAKCLLANGFEVVLADKYASGQAFRGLSYQDAIPKALEKPFQEALKYENEHVLFHHTCFLEAINEAGVREVLNRLREGLHTGAHVCFDYPTTIMPATQSVIFCGSVDSLDKVEFVYLQHERDGAIHRARLEYTLIRGSEVSCVRTPVSFIVPDLTDVLVAAQDKGFSCSLRSMPGACSLFPGEIAFVDLQLKT
jgi:hypothetical protein